MTLIIRYVLQIDFAFQAKWLIRYEPDFSTIHTRSKPHEMVCFATKFQTPEVIVSDTPDPAAHAADQTDGWLITNRNSACSIWLRFLPYPAGIIHSGKQNS